MEDYRKISVKVSVYYEIRDSEMYGGVGSIGYTCTHINGNLEMMNNDFKEYVSKQKKYFASGLGVPEECVQVITQEEYEQNTEDFELGIEGGSEYADQPTLIIGA